MAKANPRNLFLCKLADELERYRDNTRNDDLFELAPWFAPGSARCLLLSGALAPGEVRLKAVTGFTVNSDEWKQYLQFVRNVKGILPSIDDSTEILHFWGANRAKYPTLYKVAIQVVTQYLAQIWRVSHQEC
eukprot:GILJ01032654.1.p1 GENE.GILJ01032654.1~~GILJ01032654.1.p1  ORF type:complete len:152 (+),score=8.46 GILJ01032654.1:61-456(+)